MTNLWRTTTLILAATMGPMASAKMSAQVVRSAPMTAQTVAPARAQAAAAPVARARTVAQPRVQAPAPQASSPNFGLLGMMFGGGSAVTVPTKGGPGVIPSSERSKWRNSQDYESEAGCVDGSCYNDRYRKRAIENEKIYFSAFQGASTNNACTDKLLTAARGVAARYDRNGDTANGNCAYAVRLSLQKAGIHRGRNGLGHAKDMGRNLEALGYVNIYRPGMTARQAPVGAILVYDKRRPGARGCTGLGNTYGHVEIRDFGDRWLYDGTVSRPIEETKGRECRPLKGVYVPSNDMSC